MLALDRADIGLTASPCRKQEDCVLAIVLCFTKYLNWPMENNFAYLRT